MKFAIPWSNRAHHYTDEEVDVALRVIKNGDPLTQGQNLHRFEREFRRYASVEHAFAVSNATAALEIAARLCQFEPGDEVVVPAHTYTSSAYPFLGNGAKIIWADINLETRVVDRSTVERCVTENTRAVVVPHLYGFVADMPGIMELSEKGGFLVIEDAAQSLGSVVDERMSGTFGDFGVYSFHTHKNITTLGEGGMLVVKDPKLAKLVPMIRHNGHRPYGERPDYWIPAMVDVGLPILDGKPVWPMNCCLGEVECAIGSQLLGRIDQINSHKRSRALKFIDQFDDYPEIVFHRDSSSRHNYHLLAAQLIEINRDEFIRRMAISHGIQCVVQYYPLNRYPLYQEMGVGDANLPCTEEFFSNMVSFPFNYHLSDHELDQIVSAARETICKLRG